MKTMSDSEVLAAIDRGMRRVWAKFPGVDDPPPSRNADADEKAVEAGSNETPKTQ